MFRKTTVYLLLVSLLLTSYPIGAQEFVQQLPAPGTMVNLSAAYQPLMLKGVKINPKNPMQFDFLVSKGDDHTVGNGRDRSLEEESTRLIKYFLACLAIPENDLWVNLSPYEKDRMIPDALGKTELGRDLLAQDYVLKQLTASLINPEQKLGKEFWDRIYAKAQALYGTSEIPVNTFNKVWILADTAKVFEKGDTAVVVHAHLKVMLDEDYLAQEKNISVSLRRSDQAISNAQATEAILRRTTNKEIASSAEQKNSRPSRNDTSALASQIVREIVLPEIEREVNEGKNFATIRQIFHAFILASWYKKNLKAALLNQVYADKNKVTGMEYKNSIDPQAIYQQYLQAYKKGVFNYIKEDLDPTTQQPVPRKYFSGGTKFTSHRFNTIQDLTQLTIADRAQLGEVDFAVTANLQSVNPAMTAEQEQAERLAVGARSFSHASKVFYNNISFIIRTRISTLKMMVKNKDEVATIYQRDWSILEEFKKSTNPFSDDPLRIFSPEYLQQVYGLTKRVIQDLMALDHQIKSFQAVPETGEEEAVKEMLITIEELIKENISSLTSRIEIIEGLKSNEKFQIGKAIKQLREHFQRDNVEFKIQDPTSSVQGKTTSFISAIYNLVNNGLEAGKKRHGTAAAAKVVVTISHDDEGKNLAIKITDNGTGLKEEEHLALNLETGRQKIFDLDNTDKEGGTGLGTTEAWYAIHDMGGTIEARNHPDGGAEFVITLPIANSAMTGAELVEAIRNSAGMHNYLARYTDKHLDDFISRLDVQEALAHRLAELPKDFLTNPRYMGKMSRDYGPGDTFKDLFLSADGGGFDLLQEFSGNLRAILLPQYKTTSFSNLINLLLALYKMSEENEVFLASDVKDNSPLLKNWFDDELGWMAVFTRDELEAAPHFYKTRPNVTFKRFLSFADFLIERLTQQNTNQPDVEIRQEDLVTAMQKKVELKESVRYFLQLIDKIEDRYRQWQDARREELGILLPDDLQRDSRLQAHVVLLKEALATADAVMTAPAAAPQPTAEGITEARPGEGIEFASMRYPQEFSEAVPLIERRIASLIQMMPLGKYYGTVVFSRDKLVWGFEISVPKGYHHHLTEELGLLDKDGSYPTVHIELTQTSILIAPSAARLEVYSKRADFLGLDPQRLSTTEPEMKKNEYFLDFLRKQVYKAAKLLWESNPEFRKRSLFIGSKSIFNDWDDKSTLNDFLEKYKHLDSAMTAEQAKSEKNELGVLRLKVPIRPSINLGNMKRIEAEFVWTLFNMIAKEPFFKKLVEEGEVSWEDLKSRLSALLNFGIVEKQGDKYFLTELAVSVLEAMELQSPHLDMPMLPSIYQGQIRDPRHNKIIFVGQVNPSSHIPAEIFDQYAYYFRLNTGEQFLISKMHRTGEVVVEDLRDPQRKLFTLDEEHPFTFEKDPSNRIEVSYKDNKVFFKAEGNSILAVYSSLLEEPLTREDQYRELKRIQHIIDKLFSTMAMILYSTNEESSEDTPEMMSRQLRESFIRPMIDLLEEMGESQVKRTEKDNYQKLFNMFKGFRDTSGGLGGVFPEFSELLKEIDLYLPMFVDTLAQVARNNGVIIDAAMSGPQTKLTKGGIDLKASDLKLDVEKQGQGVEMNFDPAMMAQFRSGHFTGLVPVIIKITHIKIGDSALFSKGPLYNTLQID